MKNAKLILVLAFFFVAGWCTFPQVVQADLEWKTIKNLDLPSTPLDVAPSADGQWLFVLTSGEVLVYSTQEWKISNQIPIDKGFDRIASLAGTNGFTITSSVNKALQIILLEVIHKIDLSGLPFKGPQDAPVTVAVFTDYQ